MKIYISHANGFDFKKKLYAPLRESTLNEEHEFYLPHESGASVNTKELMKEYDLLIAEVSHPSTGQGIEIGRAEAFNIPIICIYEKGSKISNSLKYVTDTFIEYETPEDMIEQIGSQLT